LIFAPSSDKRAVTGSSTEEEAAPGEDTSPVITEMTTTCDTIQLSTVVAPLIQKGEKKFLEHYSEQLVYTNEARRIQMFNSINQEATIKTIRGLIILAVLAIALALFAACSGRSSAPLGGDASRAASSDKASDGQVVITGAVNKTVKVRHSMANKMPGDIRIFLGLDTICDVFINVPFDIKPGTYPIASESKSDVVFAQYNDTCNAPDSYPSTKGTLTLTAAGDKFSGTFVFTGQNKNDQSKIVEVSGSFSDLSLQ
jgi:hypothetical protein